MTSEELRELDVRVAEARGHILRPATGHWGDEGARHWEDMLYVPHYSTDPAASRVLLDEMPDPLLVRWGPNGTRYDPEHLPGHWSVTLAGIGGWTAPTLDAAICLAWLAWKGAQE